MSLRQASWRCLRLRWRMKSTYDGYGRIRASKDVNLRCQDDFSFIDDFTVETKFLVISLAVFFPFSYSTSSFMAWVVQLEGWMARHYSVLALMFLKLNQTEPLCLSRNSNSSFERNLESLQLWNLKLVLFANNNNVALSLKTSVANFFLS